MNCETCESKCDRLIEYCGLKGEQWNVCEDCEIKFDEERIKMIDDPEFPNIYPYKLCSVCDERSSCGSYNDDMYWLCESCTPEPEADSEEEEEEEDECYGKHCSNTKGLKLGLGLKRNHSDNDDNIFSEELYCDECAVYCCFADCRQCSDNFPMTEIRYRSGGAFGDSANTYHQLFCVPCIESVIAYCDRTGYMAGDYN